MTNFKSQNFPIMQFESNASKMSRNESKITISGCNTCPVNRFLWNGKYVRPSHCESENISNLPPISNIIVRIQPIINLTLLSMRLTTIANPKPPKLHKPPKLTIWESGNRRHCQLFRPRSLATCGCYHWIPTEILSHLYVRQSSETPILTILKAL